MTTKGKICGVINADMTFGVCVLLPMAYVLFVHVYSSLPPIHVHQSSNMHTSFP